MKALEKERMRRYGGAAALAEDVLRHLHNQPVIARPPSAIYTARKFLRRKRREVYFAVVVATLMAAMFALAYQAGESKRLRLISELADFRREEAQLVRKAIANQAVSEQEKLQTRACLKRLNERVVSGLGNEADHELLARMLARSVQFHGHTVQSVTNPIISLMVGTSSGFDIARVGALITPVVTVHDLRVELDNVPILLPGSSAKGDGQVIVTFLDSDSVDLSERGIDETQAADLRHRLAAFAEDWDRPEMDSYDAL